MLTTLILIPVFSHAENAELRREYGQRYSDNPGYARQQANIEDGRRYQQELQERRDQDYYRETERRDSIGGGGYNHGDINQDNNRGW